MPNIYKNHNYDKAREAIAGMKRVNYNETNWQLPFNHFKAENLTAFAFMFRLAFDQYYVENIATKAIKVKNGEMDTENLDKFFNSIEGTKAKAGTGEKFDDELAQLKNLMGNQAGTELTNISAFAGAALTAAAALGFISPPLAAISGVIALIASVWNIFSSPGKTASFDAKERMQAFRNLYNTSEKQRGNKLKHVGYWFGDRVIELRPKCVAATANCEAEHFQYNMRADIHREAMESLIKTYGDFFVDFNLFKKFIDDYDIIMAQLNAGQYIPTPPPPPPPQIEQNKSNVAKLGLVGLLIAGITGMK